MISNLTAKDIVRVAKIINPNITITKIIETTDYYKVIHHDNNVDRVLIRLTKDTLQDYTKTNRYISWSIFSPVLNTVILDKNGNIIESI